MRASTLVPIAAVEKVAKPRKRFRALFFASIASTRREPWQGILIKQRPETPYTGGKPLRQASSYVMLVESDVRRDVHGIFP